MALDYNNLDPDIIRLGRAIRDKESSGGTNLSSPETLANATSGNLQYKQATFDGQGKALGGKALNGQPLDIKNQEHQQLVFYTWAKNLKDKGYGVDQIAAAHNAGDGFLTGWEKHRGVSNGFKYDTPDYVNKVVTKYQALKGQQYTQEEPAQVVQPEPIKENYNVPIVKRTLPQRQSQIVQLQKEADTASAQAKKDNSRLGIFGNTLKGAGSILISSEKGLGETIGKIATVGQTKKSAQNIQDLTTSQITLRDIIKQREAQGKDTTALKQSYNDNQKLIGENQALIEQYNKSLPSTAKVAGQIGGTALDVLTAGTLKAKPNLTSKGAAAIGLPELGKLATQKSSGLFTLKGLSNIGKGTSIGYASDVTQGLQGNRGENRQRAEAFIPGLGTAIGTGIPAVAETVQSVANVVVPSIRTQKIVDSRLKELTKLDNLQQIKKATEKGRERGIDIKKVLSETDVLHGSVDKTGLITTKGESGAIEQYTKKYIDGNEKIVSDILKKEAKAISPIIIREKLEKAVREAGIEGKELIKANKSIVDEVDGYLLRATNSGAVPVETLHNAKIDKYNGINFFTEGATKKYDKTIAKALKELVEESTTNTNVREVNKELSKHFAVVDYLNKLDNKKVAGGKLGKYFAQTVGAIVGSNFGALGAIAGAEAGGRLKGEALVRAFRGKTNKNIPQAEAITKAKEYLAEKPLALPSYSSKSNNLGNLNINQATTIIPTIKGIPEVSTKPKKTASKLSTFKKKLKK